MKNVKSVIFCLFYREYRELEWVMPLIYSYRKRNIKTTVMLPVKAKNPRQKVTLGWVRNYADQIIYGSKLWNASWLWAIKYYITSNEYIPYEKYVPFRKSIRKILQSLFSYLDAAPKTSQSLNDLSTRKAQDILKDFDLIYCPEGFFRRGKTGHLQKLIMESIKLLKKPVIGYPISAFSENRNLVDNNKCMDLLLCVSGPDKQACEQAGIPAIVFGAQRFNRSWIMEISRYFSGYQEAINLKENLKNKSVILVLLKNRTGLVEDMISVKEQLSYRKMIFQVLIDAGFHLLIKAHPGENAIPLKDTLETIPVDSYTISEMPAQFLASISLCSVFELPSNTIMDSIAAGKKSFWPYYIIDDACKNLSAEELANKFASVDFFPTLFLTFVDIKLPDESNELAVDSKTRDKFERLVNSQVDIDCAITECEHTVMRSSQYRAS